MSIKNIIKAKQNKNDEFYTQYKDIEEEVQHYTDQLTGKHIYLNCDDPRHSQFWHYFYTNFTRLKLTRLTATYYSEDTQVNRCDVTETPEGQLRVINRPLIGNGDFRSPEATSILKEADIVVTNPPFSLFRDYIDTLVTYKKDFLVIGNPNAVTYKEIFPLIKENKVWIGHKSMGTDMLFDVPEEYQKELVKTKKEGSAYKIINGVIKGRAQAIWYTNLDVSKRHEELVLSKEYNEKEYPSYDNYDAIEVSKLKNIPVDYDGVMGVPITYVFKHNPNQFEILGLTNGRDEFGLKPTKKYTNAKQINANGTTTNGSKANTRATLLLDKKPNGIYYTADNADGPLKIVYARLLIKKKGETNEQESSQRKKKQE